jgi:hypothetical protein
VLLLLLLLWQAVPASQPDEPAEQASQRLLRAPWHLAAVLCSLKHRLQVLLLELLYM